MSVNITTVHLAEKHNIKCWAPLSINRATYATDWATYASFIMATPFPVENFEHGVVAPVWLESDTRPEIRVFVHPYPCDVVVRNKVESIDISLVHARQSICVHVCAITLWLSSAFRLLLINALAHQWHRLWKFAGRACNLIKTNLGIPKLKS